MEEIKSFREYIIENGVIEEASVRKKAANVNRRENNNYKERISDYVKNLNNSEATPETAPEQKPNQDAAPVPEQKPNQDAAPAPETAPETASEQKPESSAKQNTAQSENALEVSAPVSLKIDPKLSPIEVRSELRKQYDRIKNTYDNIESLLTAEGFKDSRKIGAPMNMIGDDSLRMLRDSWVDEWNKLIEKRRATRKNAEGLKDMQQPGITKEKRRKREEAYSNITDPNNIGHVPASVSRANEATAKNEEVAESTETLSESSINILDRKQAFLDSLRALPRVFRTSSELSSGIGNKYSSRRVLTTVDQKSDGKIGRLRKSDEEKIGVYGIGGDNNTKFADDMYNKFLKDARTIIAKERPLGLAYLRRADKNLRDYESRNYSKISDASRSAEISRDLYRAFSILTSIGSKLKSLISEYKKSLNKISDEIKIRDAKYIKDIDSTNSQKALENQEARIERRKKIDDKIADTITNNGKHAEDVKDSELKDKEEKINEKKQSDNFSQIEKLAFSELNRLAKYGDTNNYTLKKVQNECDKLTDAIKSNSKKAGWNTEKDEDGNFTTELINQKKAKAIALYIFSDNLEKLKKYSQSSKFKDFIKSNFERFWFRRAMKKFDRVSPEKIIEIINKNSGGTLPNDANSPEDKKKSLLDKANDWIYNKRNNIKPVAAKEFENSEPAEDPAESQPKNIYDYAIQKAKKMQED